MTVYYKMRQVLLQNVSGFLLHNAAVLLQNATILLQNVTLITNCGSTPNNTSYQIVTTVHK